MYQGLTGWIVIANTPDGEAPLWVRSSWIGIVLPVISIQDINARGVLTRKKLKKGTPRYCVDQKQAIDILAQTHMDAANWWKSQGFPRKNKSFAFRIEDVIVSGGLVEIKPEIRRHYGIADEGIGAEDSWANVGRGKN